MLSFLEAFGVPLKSRKGYLRISIAQYLQMKLDAEMPENRQRFRLIADAMEEGGKGDKLRSPQAGASGKHHHRAFSNVENRDERSDFCRGEHIRFPQSFGRNPYLRDWVSIHPFMPDGVIEDRRHDVANLAPRARCVLEGMQPRLNIHGANV
jgi:hypothetical protein